MRLTLAFLAGGGTACLWWAYGLWGVHEEQNQLLTGALFASMLSLAGLIVMAVYEKKL